MDKYLVIKEFPVLSPLLDNKEVKKSLRLLSVFGFNGNSVLFVTKDDNVFGFGNNRYGCLGLSTWDECIPEPTLNQTLSGKRLVNIYFGFGHCIGLTSDGQCYGWGDNEFGQSGIGSFESTHTPTLIKGLPKVVDISCGNRHTLALTSDGQVYGWGRNTFGQVGDGTLCWRWAPVLVSIKDNIVWISCGKCHSLALSATGKVYLWGLNDFGQLGRHRNCDLIEGKDRALSNEPKLIPGFTNISFIKAVCGPNHTLLLTNKGHIYGFGLNDNGQVGVDSLDIQFTPKKVGTGVQYKDIVASFDCNLSIAVSTTNHYFIWGFRRKTPLKTTDHQLGYTLMDVFAKHSKTNRTYKTIVFNVKQRKKIIECYEDINNNKVSRFEAFDIPGQQPNELKTTTKSTVSSNIEEMVVTKGSSDKYPDMRAIDDYCSLVQRKRSFEYSDEDFIPGTVVLQRMSTAFDNRLNSDIQFDINGQLIHCHKTVLQIRNKIFWQNCEKLLTKQKRNDLQINGYSYQSFYAFIGFLYGLRPDVNDQNCYELLELADNYEEWGLRCLCSKRLQSCIDCESIDILYEIAINFDLNELKICCLNFGTNCHKTVD